MKIDQGANSNSPFLRGSCLTLAWILMGVWLVTACGKKEEAPAPAVVRPVKAMTLESQSQALARKFPGRVRAHRRADLSFKVSGRLKELPAEEGMQIKKGQLLARLDPQDLQAQLESAGGQLSKAKAALGLAQTEYQRVLNIQKQDAGAVSQSLIDQRREGVARAQAEIQSLQATYNAAKLNLSYTELRAPFDGVVSKRYANNFQDVQAKEIILHIDDVSVIEVLVDVPESVIASLRRRVVADIFAEFATAPGKQFPLSVYEYTTRADPRTQTYQVTLRMDQPEEINVLPGMTAMVLGSQRDTTAVADDTFIVPAVAVWADDAGNSQVWVIDTKNNTVQPRAITTGDLTGSASIQIVAGLKPGETIAVSGVSQLREGMQVRPVDKIDF
jgi:RND family efflux transporter MFP subunit